MQFFDCWEFRQLLLIKICLGSLVKENIRLMLREELFGIPGLAVSNIYCGFWSS